MAVAKKKKTFGEVANHKQAFGEMTNLMKAFGEKVNLNKAFSEVANHKKAFRQVTNHRNAFREVTNHQDAFRQVTNQTKAPRDNGHQQPIKQPAKPANNPHGQKPACSKLQTTDSSRCVRWPISMQAFRSVSQSAESGPKTGQSACKHSVQ